MQVRPSHGLLHEAVSGSEQPFESARCGILLDEHPFSHLPDDDGFTVEGAREWHMDAELRRELLESECILLLVPRAGDLPRLSDISITQLSAGVASYHSMELVSFQGLTITTLSEDLIQRLANAVEQLLDDLVDGLKSLPLLDSEQFLVIIGHVVKDPCLDGSFTGLCVRVDIVLELSE